MELFTSFDIAAARRLPGLPSSHPCSRVHGHTFHVRITLDGEVDAVTGWVVDFGAVEQATDALRATLDHQYLNDIDGLENPTTEHLAQWIWSRLADDFEELVAVQVQEHPARGVIYRGPAS